MGDRAGRRAEARCAAAGCIGEVDDQIGAGGRGDAHFARFAQHLNTERHLRPKRGRRFAAL